MSAEPNTNQEQNIDQIIQDSMRAQYDQNMEQFAFIGRLMGWRNIKDNRKRTTVARGHAKIVSFVNSFRP